MAFEATPHAAGEGGICFADASLFLAETGFVEESIVDGPGMRCVIFVQGCPHACPGCHNPATHPFTGGHPVLLDELYQRIRKQALCRGVTFSGGEPFCQATELAMLADKLKKDGYELAAYSGYTFEQLLDGDEGQRKLLGLLDILVDGRFDLEQRDLTLRFRGSRNQRILDVAASLEQQAPVLETASRWVGHA